MKRFLLSLIDSFSLNWFVHILLYKQHFFKVSQSFIRILLSQTDTLHMKILKHSIKKLSSIISCSLKYKKKIIFFAILFYQVQGSSCLIIVELIGKLSFSMDCLFIYFFFSVLLVLFKFCRLFLISCT